MELKIDDYKLPASVTFNYEELKAELTEKVKLYETMVYTEEQIKDAKMDRASLNKLKKALNDERIRREKEYMIPFNDFKSKINEIIAIIDKPVALIDAQVKGFEEQKKAEKKTMLKGMWQAISHDDLDLSIVFNEIFNEKWLNASTSINQIKTEMEDAIEKYRKEIEIIKRCPYSEEAIFHYKHTLDLAASLELADAVAKEKGKEEEKKKTESFSTYMAPPEEEEEEASWVNFSCLLSYAKAKALKEFLKDNNIEYKAI